MKKTEKQASTQAPTAKAQVAAGYQTFKDIVGKIVMFLYHARKVVLAAPVVYVALRLAIYNQSHLPEQVGLNLQPNGVFAMQIARQTAVLGPLAVTGVCLLMMFLSRKALHSWAVSVFTLILPIILLLSNQYPA